MADQEFSYTRRLFLTAAGATAAVMSAAGLSGAAAAAQGPTPPEPGRLGAGRLTRGLGASANTVITCACAAPTAALRTADGAHHTAEFSGFFAAQPTTEFERDGVAYVGLSTSGHSTIGSSPTLGTFRVFHDMERPEPYSYLREVTAGAGFPAEQHMFVNVLVTADAFPGIVLRNTATGKLKASAVTSLPPEDATYTLQQPLTLERVDRPGEVLLTIESYSTVVNPSSRRSG